MTSPCRDSSAKKRCKPRKEFYFVLCELNDAADADDTHPLQNLFVLAVFYDDVHTIPWYDDDIHDNNALHNNLLMQGQALLKKISALRDFLNIS